MTMTVDDVMDLLSIVAYQNWQVDDERHPYGWIRNEQHQCPLCALAEELGGYHFTIFPSMALESISAPIKDTVRNEIMFAADRVDHPLRERLLYTLGIET